MSIIIEISLFETDLYLLINIRRHMPIFIWPCPFFDQFQLYILQIVNFGIYIYRRKK